MTCDETFTLTIQGDLTEDGLVPVPLLLDKLTHLQRLMYSIGSSLAGGGARGTIKPEVKEACTLHFVNSEPGSLRINTTTQTNSLMQQPLGAELGIAHAAKVNLLKTMRAVCSRDNEKLHLLYPDYRHRASVLKQAEALLPEETFDYEISLTYTEDNLTLDADDRAFVKQFILQDFRSSPPEENVELTGILYSIEVLTGKPHIGILSGHRKIACYFNKEYEDVVRDLMPGSLVEVEGWATFTDKGLIDTIETLYDVRPVQIFPLRIKRIRFEGRIFHLNDSIHVEVNYVDGVYVAEYKALNIMGYGPTRNEALNHFKLDFVLIWDELVQEEDDLLTSDAIDLKNKVKQLVSSFEWVDSN